MGSPLQYAANGACTAILREIVGRTGESDRWGHLSGRILVGGKLGNPGIWEWPIFRQRVDIALVDGDIGRKVIVPLFLRSR